MKAPMHPEWAQSSQLGFTVVHGKFHLGVVVRQDPKNLEWIAVAISTPTAAITLDAVLDNHAHQNIGSFSDLPGAMAAGEDYAWEWIKGRNKEAEKCLCSAIDAKKSSRRKTKPKTKPKTKKT